MLLASGWHGGGNNLTWSILNNEFVCLQVYIVQLRVRTSKKKRNLNGGRKKEENTR